MNSEEFEKMLKKTVNPGRCREVLVGSGELFFFIAALFLFCKMFSTMFFVS